MIIFTYAQKLLVEGFQKIFKKSEIFNFFEPSPKDEKKIFYMTRSQIHPIKLKSTIVPIKGFTKHLKTRTTLVFQFKVRFLYYIHIFRNYQFRVRDFMGRPVHSNV